MGHMKSSTKQGHMLTLENGPYRLTVQNLELRSRVREEEFGWSSESAERAESEFNVAKADPAAWISEEK